ncbi:tudor domain-containing protein 15 [Indicator indicator]|uniref:tudor domain-containing protein 15 n=1 Tax=Indicator indicator TaxID=1002788 RepID=UPI0023DEAF6B|nr:tudor domain-containing protein 15 [Indicator indicator]
MDSLTLSPNRVDTNLKITSIECHPESLVIVFQGQYKGGCELDYYILQNEIQRVFKVRGNVYIGESCLVEDAEGTWHRGRVLEKSKNVCEVYFIDTGQVLFVEETRLASACDEFFQLPPKVVLGVFARILPLGEKWDPKAVNYFSSLVGLQIRGHVKAVMSYQLFILEVPKIISDILELKLGKLIDGDSFCLIVDMLRAFPQEMLCKRVPQVLQHKYPVKGLLTFSKFEKPTDFWPVPHNLFPRVPVGSEVNVKITVEISQNKFYCQMQKWQKELEDLTGAMHLYYEAINTKNKKSVDSLGLLCAAKRQTGQWHRGVIKEVLSDGVEVWFMDFGNSETVPFSCVQKLKAEFMALPMISFPCALSCFSGRDENVIKIQLKELTQALIRQTSVCVHIDVFSDVKRLYYITLRNQKLESKAEYPRNLNEADAPCVSLLDTKITSIAESNKSCPEQCSSLKNCNGNKHVENLLPKWDISLSSCCRRAEMQVNSSYTAYVVHVINPSDFFIQTCEYQKEFQALMKSIADTYTQCEADEMILKNPNPGFLCCARYSKDMCYYRAVVIEVLHVNVTVYFLDFGNRDIVPCYDVKALLPEFSDLPALAVCCALAHVFPVDDVWVKKAVDFFKEIVCKKPLLLRVIGKENNRYIVNAVYRDGLQQGNVATCMVQAGYAEYLEKTPDSVLNLGKKRQNLNPHKYKNKVNAQNISNVHKNKVPGNRGVFQKPKTLSMSSVLKEPVVLSSFGKSGISKRHKLVPEEKLFYKEFIFKPGAVLEVVCSCFVSPGDFSCQLRCKLPELNNLMEQIQTYYKEHTSPYKSGQVACVVKYAKDGKWYRATVVQQVSTSEADVVFVDYGYRKRVFLKDLQAVIPDFLTLESQAFQCGFKNAYVQTKSFQWSEEVCRYFEDLISASGGPLTCIIYAVVRVSPNRLCYIVDLQTPSFTAEEFLGECGLTQSGYIDLRNLAFLGSLYSFCYSSFNIKIGSEEEVYITHVYSPSKFYCQLNRNTETIEALMKKVNVISKMSKNAKYDTSSTQLCIARYFEDGLFYRALAFPVESTSYLCANFVDFGNKSMVERDQVIPIPDIATDLIFTPMQAIKCCLSDLRETEIPAKVTIWFEKTFHGKLLKAVIVSKESDGQLVVDLYDGQVSVSQKIEEKIMEDFPLKKYTGHLTRSNKGVICHMKDDKELSKVVELNIAETVQLKTELKCQVYGKYCETNSEQNFRGEKQTAHSTQNLCSGFSKLLTLQNSEEPGFRNAVNAELEHREESPVGKPDSHSLCHPALKSKELIVGKVCNKTVTGEFLQQHREQWEIDVTCDGKSVSDDLQKKGRTRWQKAPMHNWRSRPKQIMVTNGNHKVRKSRSMLGGWSKTDVITMKTTSKMPLNGFPQDINSGQVERAKVTNISESGEFHMQLHRNLQILQELNVMLIEEAQRSDCLREADIEEGLECMTKSEMDLKWYRTKVLKTFIREKLMLVFLVDYGNCEMVCLNNAKMLSNEVKYIPKQAVFCKWIWFKNLKKIQFVHVVNALQNCEIRILFLRYLESYRIWEVDILIGEILLQEYLNQVLSNFQTTGPEKSSNTDCKELNPSFNINSIMWMLLHNDRRHPGFPTAVTDPSNFCIQFEILFNVMQNLSLLLTDLPDNLPTLPEELVSPGASCLIKFGLEAQWNRAEITEVTSQSVVLKFIDYGFLKSIPYSDIHKLKVIPDSLLYLPHLAHSCTLHGVVPATGECWSDEAKVLFHRLLSKPGLILHFKHYGPGMKLEVDVLYEECSVAHDLVAAGHAVYSKIRCCFIPPDRIIS